MVRVTPVGGPPANGGDFRRDEQDTYPYEEPAAPGGGGVVAWVRKRWWAALLLGLLAAGVIVAAVVGPVCGIKGCPRKSSGEPQDAGPPRLIVKFNLPDIDALELLPTLLRNYTTRVNLTSSLLQILDFVDEQTLQEALKYLLQNTELSLLTRDFTMQYNPTGVFSSLNWSDPSSLVNSALLEAGGVLDQVAEAINGSATGTIDLSTVQWRRRRRGRQRRRTLLQDDPQIDTGGEPYTDYDSEGYGTPSNVTQVGAVLSLNDPYVKNGYQWHHTRIRSSSAWTSTEGDASVVVAVIDGGFDLTHPDLARQLWVNTREVPGDGIDNDGDTYVDDVHGYDFMGACKPNSATPTAKCVCTGRPDPLPSDGHGTHVAGLIAATANNGIGGAGTAPNVKLMLLGAANCLTGGLDASTVVKALDYAANQGAHIVSMSLGTEWDWQANPRSPAPTDGNQWSDWLSVYTAAIKPLADKGILVVAAAGNENVDLDNIVKLGYTYVPCVVPLDNVLCVGASDMRDNMAFFSNYGATQVDLSSPGENILSTLWVGPGTHTYGQMNGSSMSTPIVSGVAALVASALGARDRNFTQAKKIKQILMDSGDTLPGLAGTSVSGKRVNAYSALTMAMDSFTSASYVPSLAPVSLPTQPPGVLRVVGFMETYWTNANPAVLDIGGAAQVDETIRSGGPRFTNFKALTGVMVNATAALLVNTSGLHTFTLAYPVQYLGGKIQVNGVSIGLTIKGTYATGAFMARVAGWYKVSFLMLPVADPIGAVTVMLTPPGAAQPNLYTGSYQAWTTRTYSPPALSNNYTSPMTSSLGGRPWGFNTGWWVFMNTSAPLTFTKDDVGMLFTQVKTTTSGWQTQLIAGMDNLASSTAFRAALLPGDATSKTALGYATTTWDTTGLPTNIMLHVLCKGCIVQLNGQPVVDSYASFTLAVPTLKSSSCITIKPGTRYTVTIKFATTLLVSGDMNRMLLKYTPCTGGSLLPVTGLGLGPAVIDTAPGTSMVENYIGWIGGVQCDVWRVPLGSVDVPASTPPMFKVRLPLCPSPELHTGACSTPWSFTLDSIVRGAALASSTPAGTTYAVRCWAYTNSTTALPGLTQLSAAPAKVHARVWLAGMLRYHSTPASVVLRAALPGSIRYATQLHQLLVDWVGVGPTQVLSVMAGGTPVNINLQAFQLPLWCTFDGGESMPQRVFDPLLNMRPIGNGGVFMQAYLPGSSDVAGAVCPNPQLVSSAAGSFTSSSLGLTAGVRTSTYATLANKVWYAVVEGYYWTVVDTNGGWAALQYDEPAGAATMVLAGDVVLRNSPAYSPSSTALKGVQFDIALPYCYLHMKLVTKIMNSAGSIAYRWQAKTPSQTSVFDQYTWFRTSWEPQTP